MTAIQQAFTRAGVKPRRTEPVTPQNPSRSATARVKDALPVPTTCPNCGKPVELVDNATIYGRAFGEWPYAYACTDKACNSYVGLHPFTALPLGTLANAETREARKEAKAEFQKLWKSGEMTRGAAYVHLAGALGIPVEQCHFGWFDISACQRALRALTT